MNDITALDISSLKPVFYWAGLFILLLLELLFPYRLSSVSKLKRWRTNLPLAIINGLIYYLVYFSALAGIMAQGEKLKIGLLHVLPLPGWVKIVAGIVILDFTLYVWHLLNHTVPLFWRFHRVHHADMNLDVSTAGRFHLGELLMSGLVRIMVVYAAGISFTTYVLFEILSNASIQFHHSSVRIHPLFEKFWVLLFIPPSMHRVHHSVKIKERNSNYGALFSFWDRLLGTFTWGIDQSTIVIGIGSHRTFEKLGFWYSWLMPFTRRTM